MKGCVLEGFAGTGVRLAVLSALVLGIAGLCPAQTTAGASAQSTKATAPANALGAVAWEAKSVAQNGQTTIASKPKGTQEGIKVHGHWTIEVRNPDGKLVSHTEFENSLVQPDGPQNLAALLLGTEVPGGYFVYLTNGTNSFAGPCPTINTSDTACNLIGSLMSPTPATFGDQASGCGGTGFKNAITAAGPCFPLSISLVANTGLAVSGTAVAATSSQITDVYLSPIVCGRIGTTTIVSTAPSACAQGQPGEGPEAYLTHATLPTAVQVTADQSIAVNVQVSFQ